MQLLGQIISHKLIVLQTAKYLASWNEYQDGLYLSN